MGVVVSKPVNFSFQVRFPNSPPTLLTGASVAQEVDLTPAAPGSRPWEWKNRHGAWFLDGGGWNNERGFRNTATPHRINEALPVFCLPHVAHQPRDAEVLLPQFGHGPVHVGLFSAAYDHVGSVPGHAVGDRQPDSGEKRRKTVNVPTSGEYSKKTTCLPENREGEPVAFHMLLDLPSAQDDGNCNPETSGGLEVSQKNMVEMPNAPCFLR